MPDTLERRGVAELRATGHRLEGYAATFGTEARIADFTEVIAPGAFKATLASGRDTVALVDHDPTLLLGRTRSGTLRLSDDTRGLSFSLDIPDTGAGRDVLALAARGDVGGASFGFKVVDERWTGRRRELRAVDLHEISIVSAWPAYPQTSVTVRSRPRLALARLWLETVR